MSSGSPGDPPEKLDQAQRANGLPAAAIRSVVEYMAQQKLNRLHLRFETMPPTNQVEVAESSAPTHTAVLEAEYDCNAIPEQDSLHAGVFILTEVADD